MQKFRTHYDNLKVTRNATTQVIRESYRRLSLKYHPDRNLDNPDASRIMAILNSSYEVLSDPTQRKLHDEWINQKETHTESKSFRHPFHTFSQGNPKRQNEIQIVNGLKTKADLNRLFFTKYLSFLMVGIFVWFSYVSDQDIDPIIGRSSYIALPKATQFIDVASIAPVLEKPPLAPNGKPWPVKAGYLLGYDKLNTSGKSVVTIDNTKNDTDFHVKLVLIDSEVAFPVRQFYLPAHKKFNINNITAGFYDVRYRDLITDRLSRSGPFLLEESEIKGKVEFSNLNITLPKVQHEEYQRYALAENEF